MGSLFSICTHDSLPRRRSDVHIKSDNMFEVYVPNDEAVLETPRDSIT